MNTSGTYGTVVVRASDVVKTAKYNTCETFLRELYFTAIVPFAVKPISVEFNEKIRIVYPHAGTLLIDQVHRLPAGERVSAVYQLLQKVHWMHEHGILHNDLMPGNILYRDGVVHIIDMGLTDHAVLCSTYPVYTEYYRAPELARALTPHTTKTDAWAVGCLIMFFIGGNDADRALSTGRAREFVRTLPGEFPRLVRGLMQRVPEHRSSMSDALAHVMFATLPAQIWPAPVLQYTSMPRGNHYRQPVHRMHALAVQFQLSGAVLANAIHLYQRWHTLGTRVPGVIMVHACLSVSNKVAGTMLDLNEMMSLGTGYSAACHELVELVSPHFILHPVRTATLAQILKLYTCAC